MPVLSDSPLQFPKLGVRSDTCWVCDARLLDSGGDSFSMRNEHHVIPRAYGGADGPTVSLDSAHHDLLHLIADKMMSKNPWQHLLDNLSRTQKERLLYLATRIVVAAEFSEKDPNKRVSLVLSFSQKQNTKIKALADLHGCSRQELLLRLLDAEYTRCFQVRK